MCYYMLPLQSLSPALQIQTAEVQQHGKAQQMFHNHKMADLGPEGICVPQTHILYFTPIPQP